MGIASLAAPNFVVSSFPAAELAPFAGLGAASASASVALAQRARAVEGMLPLEQLPSET